VSEFSIDLERTEAGLLLRLHGDLDMAVSPILREQLQTVLEQKPGRIIVDLKGVTMVDSSGIAVMIEALRHCRRRHVGLALQAPSQPVRRVLELARLDEGVFEILEPPS
jgi:anti-anti-sigma factor